MQPKIKIRYSPLLAAQKANNVVIKAGDTVIVEPSQSGRKEVRGKIDFIDSGLAHIIAVVSYKPYRTKPMIKHVDSLILVPEITPSDNRLYPAKYKRETLMPFGKHKGKTISLLPAAYCLYLLNHCNPFGDMKEWLEANKAVFENELYNVK